MKVFPSKHVKSSIVFKESVRDAYEILIVDAFFNSVCLRLILVYRTPTCHALETSKLLKVISDFTSNNGPSLVLGDFNMPDIDWQLGSSSCPLSKEFIEIARSHKLVQLVNEPTRDKSCLDLVFCNSCSLVHELRVLPPIGTSDHSTIEFQIKVSSGPTVFLSISSLTFGNGPIDRHQLQPDSDPSHLFSVFPKLFRSMTLYAEHLLALPNYHSAAGIAFES
ncbi:hypothetical protein OSTOST_09629 [Ostertagia ostertagi]